MPYGGTTLCADIPWGRALGTLDVADAPELPRLDEAVREALVAPLGMERGLFDIVRPGESVALIVSDSFRQTRADRFLPVLVDGLNRAGIRDGDIQVCYSTGTHRGPAPEEQKLILGAEMYARLGGHAFAHDAHDSANLELLGTTRRGTPVWINRRVLACDRIVATGTVVLHYFGGFGGGRKSIVPGIAGVETISRNHSMNLDPHSDRLNPDVRIGVLDGNPVAEDMLEAAQFVPVDFILNTVLNRQGRIAGLFAGEMDAAHRAACRMAYELYSAPIDEQADLVVASAGSAKNFVQSHKALFNAYQAVKPGGRIVFVAPCPEGPGSEQFTQWLRRRDRADIIAGLRERAEINGQTALSTVEKAPLACFVTEMGEDSVALLRGRKAESLTDALNKAHAELTALGTPDPTVWLMPSAGYTVPFVSSG
ncbi:MAG: nickel-dependent lactate racemase [FCB group bacterium]|nr:nickel-dependent lactate racemase [FCB group bacterium]